jgi:hypothetical protein
VVVRVRKAVRHLSLRPEVLASTGAQNEASWREMMSRIDAREREREGRLRKAEKALNALTMS